MTVLNSEDNDQLQLLVDKIIKLGSEAEEEAIKELEALLVSSDRPGEL